MQQNVCQRKKWKKKSKKWNKLQLIKPNFCSREWTRVEVNIGSGGLVTDIDIRKIPWHMQTLLGMVFIGSKRNWRHALQSVLVKQICNIRALVSVFRWNQCLYCLCTEVLKANRSSVWKLRHCTAEVRTDDRLKCLNNARVSPNDESGVLVWSPVFYRLHQSLISLEVIDALVSRWVTSIYNSVFIKELKHVCWVRAGSTTSVLCFYDLLLSNSPQVTSVWWTCANTCTVNMFYFSSECQYIIH